MGRNLRSTHTEAVEELENHFSERLDDERVRWDTILVEEKDPGGELGIDGELDGEVDIALINGDEAYVLELKTATGHQTKGEEQIGKIIDFFRDAGYDAWGVHHLNDCNDYMDSEELAKEIHQNFGGIFDKDDLDEIIEYQNTWGSFGYVRSALSRDLTNVDPLRKFHVESNPYDFDKLEERGIMESEVGKVYRFTEEYKNIIENGDEEFTFILQPTAYEKYDL